MKKQGNRTQETYEKYIESRNSLTEEQKENFHFNLENENILHEWKYWVLIPNDFPYDAVLSKHNMLVPKRAFPDLSESTDEEFHELQDIKLELSGEYDAALENFKSNRSVSEHFHLHVIHWK